MREVEAPRLFKAKDGRGKQKCWLQTALARELGGRALATAPKQEQGNSRAALQSLFYKALISFHRPNPPFWREGAEYVCELTHVHMKVEARSPHRAGISLKHSARRQEPEAGAY